MAAAFATSGCSPEVGTAIADGGAEAQRRRMLLWIVVAFISGVLLTGVAAVLLLR